MKQACLLNAITNNNIGLRVSSHHTFHNYLRTKLRNIKYGAVLFFFASFTLIGCVDLDVSPTNKLTENNYWTSETNAKAVLSMAYSQMLNSDCFFNNEVLSDNVYNGRGAMDEKIIASGLGTATTGRFENEWTSCYAGIKTCHVFLANIDKVTMDATLKARMIAEARFIRAYLYLRLTTWFGDVPFFTQDLTLSESKSIGRTAQSDVYRFIHQEFQAIATALPPKEQYSTADRGRITRGAAIALDARAYLYQSDWANVITSCEKLMNTTDNGSYSLFPSYAGLFTEANEYNQEVILDLEYVPIVHTWNNMFDLVPLSVGARDNLYAPTQELVNDYLMLDGTKWDSTKVAYTNRDPRLQATLVYDNYSWQGVGGAVSTIRTAAGTNTVNSYSGQGQNSTSTGYYYRKYFDVNYTGSFASGLNLILIRYADILLMYAEAKNELGVMNSTIWDATIKLLRTRAGFTATAALNYPGGSSADLQTIIRTERRCELALEGLRVFDIRRWKTAETVLNTPPHGAKFGDASIDNGYIRLNSRIFNKNRDYLWAIPSVEIDLDPNLSQNPGY